MSEYLVVRLTEDASEAAWIALDDDGHRLAQTETGTLGEAARAAQGRRVMLLVDGLSVITTTAALPVKSQSRLLKMLPFALEDVVAEDVEGFQFCPGVRRSDGEVPVAIVAKRQLDDWLVACSQAGLSPSVVYADTEGVPETPGHLTLVLESGRVSGRLPTQAPFALDGVSLGDVLEIVSSTDDSDAASWHVVIFADEAGYERAAAEIDRLRDAVASLDLQVSPDGPLPRLGATLVNAPGSNLLQGAYAPKSNWAAVIRPWRLAAALLLSLAVLATLTEGVRYYSLSRQDQALTAQLETGCRNAFQTPQLASCRNEIQRRLAAAGAESGDAASPAFLATLAAVAEARDPESRIEALNYRDGVTDLRVIAPDVSALDGFAREMANGGRFQVNIQSANPSDDGVEGRLQVSEALP